MRIGIDLRTRAIALFAMLFLFMGIVGGIPGLAAVGGGDAAPFVVGVQADSVEDLFKSGNVISELDKDKSTNLGTVEDKAREVAQTLTTILTIISFACLLFWIARLAMSAGNPMSRRMALTGIMFSGVALALFGGAWVVVSFFWNFLSGTP